MFQQTSFGGQNPQSNFGFKPSTENNQFGQGMFGSGLPRPTNTFGTAPFSPAANSSSGFSFGRGMQTPQPTSFGSTTQTNAFGSSAAQQPTFGSTSTQPSAFGTTAAQQQPVGFFGQTAGSGTTGGIGFTQQADVQRQQQGGNTFGLGGATGFGQMNPGLTMNKQFGSMSSNMFSSMGNITTTTTNCGTTAPSYFETAADEQGSLNSAALLIHICAKQPYSSWSIEELRWKDYQLGRKPQQNRLKQTGLSSTMGFGMGQSQQQPGAFGMTPNTTSFNLFDRGQQSNRMTTPFGTSNSNRFGPTQQQPAFLDKNLNAGATPGGMSVFGGMGNRQTATNTPFTFGTQNQTTGGFSDGASTTPAFWSSTFSSLGAPQQPTPNAFNVSSSQPNTFQSAFGSSSQNTAVQKPPLFGLSQQSSSLQPSQPGPLGAQTMSSAGQSSTFKPFEPQTQSLFGGGTSTGLFSSSLNTQKPVTPAFGQTQGLFSSQPSQTPSTAPSIFGNALSGSAPFTLGNTQSQPTTGSLLTPTLNLQSNQGLQSSNKFSLSGQTGVPSLFGGISTVQPPTTATGLSFMQPIPQSTLQPIGIGTQLAQNRVLTSSIDTNPYGLFDRSAFPLVEKPKGTQPNGKSSSNAGLSELPASKVAERYFSSIKLDTKPNMKIKIDDMSLPNIITPHDYAFMNSESRFSFRRPHHRLLVEGINTTKIDSTDNPEQFNIRNNSNDTKVPPGLCSLLKTSSTHHSIGTNNYPSAHNKKLEDMRETSHSDKDCELTKYLPFDDEFLLPDGSKEVVYRPTFNPSLICLANMRDEELMKVKNFKIWAEEVGSITFLEDVNMFDLVTDISVESLWKKFNELVKFMRRIVSVYPSKSNKHSRGKGLNIKAEISLKNCYPKSKLTSKSDSVVKVEYDAHVRSLEKANGTKFKSYDYDTGTWTFTVDHFTTYGFGVNNQEGHRKTGLISNDEPTESNNYADPALTEKCNGPVDAINPSSAPDLPQISSDSSHKSNKPVEQISEGTPYGNKNNNSYTKDGDHKKIPSSSDTVINDLGSLSDEYNIKNDSRKNKKRVTFATDTEISPVSCTPSDSNSKRLKENSVMGVRTSSTDSLNSFLKQLRPGLSSLEDPRSYVLEAKNKGNTDSIVAVSTTREDSSSNVCIDNGYSTKLSSTSIDLISSNNGMFGVGWGPKGMLITLVKNKYGFSNKIYIAKINLFECSSSPTFKPDRKLITKSYELLLETALSGYSIVNCKHLLPGRAKVNILSSPKTHPASHDGSSLSSLEASLESTVSVSSLSVGVTNPLVSKDGSDLKLVPRASFDFVEFEAFQKVLTGYLSSEGTNMSNVSSYYKDLIRIFNLASILYDPLSASEISDIKNHKNFAYLCEGIRRNKFSSWLTDTLGSNLDDMLKDANEPHKKIIAFMVCGQMARAVKMALECKYYRLAAIMTQLCGAFHLKISPMLPLSALGRQEVDILRSTPHGIRGMDSDASFCVAQQVCAWNDYKKKSGVKMYSPCINPSVINMWSLCSGRVNLWHSSIFSCVKGWKNAFALFFWYGGSCSWSIPQSLKSYEEFYEKFSNVETPHSDIGTGEDKFVKVDPCYLLLKLFSGLDVDIKSVFDTSNYSETPLDCVVTWLLCAAMLSISSTMDDTQDARIYAPKLNHVKDCLKEVFYSLTHTLLFTLEGIGLWKWALYVALFLENEEERKAVIISILTLNYPCDDSSGSNFANSECELRRYTASIFGEPRKTPHKDSPTYKFITETLCVPSAWIHDARSLRGFYDNNNLMFVISQIDSGMLLSAYQSLAMGVFVDSIITGDVRFVKSLLEVLEQKSEAFPVKSGINFLQKCISVVEIANEIEEFERRKLPPHSLRNTLELYKENLNSTLKIFSNGMTLEKFIGISPINKDDPVYRAILERFSFRHFHSILSKAELLQNPSLINDRRVSKFFICLSLIHEKYIDTLLTFQHLYSEDFARDIDKGSIGSLITFSLPPTSGLRVQRLRRIIANDMLVTRAVYDYIC